MKKILITGGAGYIGRQIIDILSKQRKYKIFVIDDLSATKKNYLNKNINFLKVNLLNKKKVNEYFSLNKFESVIHLAAKCIVSEGEKNKKYYFNNNVVGTKNLINCCIKYGVQNFIFSSSCTIFSNNIKIVKENSRKKPISFYGKTKLMCEKIIQNKLKKTNTKFIILRYFNVVGADVKKKIGEFNTKDRLFNNFSRKVLLTKNLNIYGNSYNTKDGTCIRDYIHVFDLATIHIKCLEKFKTLKKKLHLNCSYGKGYSVLEIAKKFQKLKKNKIKIIYKDKRKGDMQEISTSNKKLNKFIKWSPKYNNLTKMVKSSFFWNKYLLNKVI